MTLFSLTALWLLLTAVSGFGQTGAQESSEAPVVYAIKVVGNRVTDTDFILREMDLKPGVVITEELVRRDRNWLASLGLFNRVEIQVAEDQGRAVVLVEVSEPFYLYPIVIWSFDPARSDRQTYGLVVYHANFRGYGEKFGGGGWGGATRGFSLFLYDPWFSLGGRYGIDALAAYSQGEVSARDGRLVEREMQGLTTTVRKRWSRWNWVEAEFGWETVESLDTLYTFDPSGNDRMAILRLRQIADHRDYKYYPAGGYFLVATAGANRLIDVPHNYYQQELDLRVYHSPPRGIVAARVFGALAEKKLPDYHSLMVDHTVFRAGDIYRGPEGYAGMLSLEYRFNLLRRRYFSYPWVPFFGQFLMNLKFSMEGVVFVDRGFIGEWTEGMVKDLRGWGGGLQFQVAYLETVHVLAGWTPEDKPSEPTVTVGFAVTY